MFRVEHALCKAKAHEIATEEFHWNSIIDHTEPSELFPVIKFRSPLWRFLTFIFWPFPAPKRELNQREIKWAPHKFQIKSATLFVAFHKHHRASIAVNSGRRWRAIWMLLLWDAKKSERKIKCDYDRKSQQEAFCFYFSFLESLFTSHTKCSYRIIDRAINNETNKRVFLNIRSPPWHET